MSRPDADFGTDAAVIPVRAATVVFALSVGIIAWMVHLVGASAIVPAACEGDAGWSVDALTVVTALACIAGIPAGVHVRRAAGDGDDARATGYRILGYVAITANVLSLALVLGEGAMHLWVSTCR